MAITNKYTLEKMKKKNPKSIRVEKSKKKLTFTDATKKNVPGTPIVPKESKPENLGEKGFKLKFGDAFRIAKKDGKKVFTWKGNKYTTQTKAELENGKSEKAKFTRKGKSIYLVKIISILNLTKGANLLIIFLLKLLIIFQNLY